MDADSSYGDWFSISGGSVTSLTFTPLSSRLRNVHLNVQLQAVNAARVYSNSAVASTKALAAPSGLSASLSGGSVSLSWNNPFDDSINGKYQYRIKTVGAGSSWPSTWSEIDVSSDNVKDSSSGKFPSTFSTSITVTGSGERNVQLRAKGDNNPATIVSTGPPAAPVASRFSTSDGAVASGYYNNLYAPAGSPKGTIVVNWVAPGDDSILKYQYRFRAQSRPASYSQWIDIPGSGASTTTHTFVFPTPEMYRVRLRAVNSAGPGGATTFNMRPVWPALAAPSGLSASLSGSSVSLSWDNPFDGSIRRYQYRIKTASAAWTDQIKWVDIANSHADTTSATITVTGSGRRTVQLRTKRSLGDPSPAATASTGPPAAPVASRFSTSDGAVASGGYNSLWAPAGSPKGSIVVNWVAPGDDSIIKYQYRFRAQSRPGYSQWIDMPGSGAATTTHTFVFPTAEMYRVRLRAVNSAGPGGVTTFNMRPVWPALAAPSGLSASLSGSSVSLSWDNPFDGSIRRYQYRIKTASAAWTDQIKWVDIANSHADTTSATITVTGSGRRTVQLRTKRSLGDPSPAATASTE